MAEETDTKKKKRTPPPPVTVVTPQMAMDLLGFEKWDDMMLALKNAARIDVESFVQKQAQREFYLRHGQAATPEGFRKLAAGAVHTATRLRVLATEVAALRNATKIAEQLRKSVAAFARENVDRMT
ncbi:MAG: hypothetical protein ACLSU5_08360, partial [Sutterella wadsworthensis]